MNLPIPGESRRRNTGPVSGQLRRVRRRAIRTPMRPTRTTPMTTVRTGLPVGCRAVPGLPALVEDGLATGGEPVAVGSAAADAVNATTLRADGATSRPSPAAGVGKWLAGAPMDTRCFSFPVAGSSADMIPSRLMDQIRCAAKMGGPPPLPDFQISWREGGDAAA